MRNVWPLEPNAVHHHEATVCARATVTVMIRKFDHATSGSPPHASKDGTVSQRRSGRFAAGSSNGIPDTLAAISRRRLYLATRSPRGRRAGFDLAATRRHGEVLR